MAEEYNQLIYFDKIYPNYKTALEAVGGTESFGDGVYPGRFVLIDYEYDNGIRKDNFDIDQEYCEDSLPDTASQYGYHLAILIKTYDSNMAITYNKIGSLFVESPSFAIEQIAITDSDGTQNPGVNFIPRNNTNAKNAGKWEISIGNNPTFAIKTTEPNLENGNYIFPEPKIIYDYDGSLGHQYKWVLELEDNPNFAVKVFDSDDEDNEISSQPIIKYDNDKSSDTYGRWVFRCKNPEFYTSLKDLDDMAKEDNDSTVYKKYQEQQPSISYNKDKMAWHLQLPKIPDIRTELVPAYNSDQKFIFDSNDYTYTLKINKPYDFSFSAKTIDEFKEYVDVKYSETADKTKGDITFYVPLLGTNEDYGEYEYISQDDSNNYSDETFYKKDYSGPKNYNYNDGYIYTLQDDGSYKLTDDVNSEQCYKIDFSTRENQKYNFTDGYVYIKQTTMWGIYNYYKVIGNANQAVTDSTINSSQTIKDIQSDIGYLSQFIYE